MQGKILSFSIQENTGYILGDDGKHYSFVGVEWKENALPIQEKRVQFEIASEGKATQVNYTQQQTVIEDKEDFQSSKEYLDQLEVEKTYGMGAWFKKCMRNYINFSGRASKREFWAFVLITFLIQIIPTIIIFTIAILIAGNAYRYEYTSMGSFGYTWLSTYIAILCAGGYYLVCACIFLLPSLAVTVRRLHDIGQSGWWALLIIITYITPLLTRIGGPFFALIAFIGVCILFLVWCSTDTKPKANQWGLPAK